MEEKGIERAQDREERVPEHVKITKHFMEHADPLAAKLGTCAEKYEDPCLFYSTDQKQWRFTIWVDGWGGDYWADTPLAAVAAALEEVEG